MKKMVGVLGSHNPPVSYNPLIGKRVLITNRVLRVTMFHNEN